MQDGTWVREQRKARGWTQVELAKRSAYSQGSISDLENGRTALTPRTLRWLKSVFDNVPATSREKKNRK